jgi:CheY-like chemotaxis protein
MAARVGKNMRTILVIDDDPVFLKELQTLLGEAGYRVLQGVRDMKVAIRPLSFF